MPQLNIHSKSLLTDFFNRVFDTNEEFAANHGNDFFERFQDQQNPYMTIVKCSDSRVQMESFDRTPQNGVFAIRNIGNQIVTCEGSIDYGVRVLKTPILFIIGHSACGAIYAALTKNQQRDDALQDIPLSVHNELENMKLISDNLSLAVIENINTQVNVATKKYEDLIDSKKLTVIGAVYDFKNDYGFGKGSIVFVNINGMQDVKEVRGYLGDKVKNLNFYCGIPLGVKS